MTHEISEADRAAPPGERAWLLPLIVSSILALIWGGYMMLVFYEIMFVSIR